MRGSGQATQECVTWVCGYFKLTTVGALESQEEFFASFLTAWGASLVAQKVKHLPAMQETRVQSLDWEDPLEKEMATHSSTLAWKMPWTEEPGRLQSMGSQRVRHNWATSLTAWKNLDKGSLPGRELLPERTSYITKVYLNGRANICLPNICFSSSCKLFSSPLKP